MEELHGADARDRGLQRKNIVEYAPHSSRMPDDMFDHSPSFASMESVVEASMIDHAEPPLRSAHLDVVQTMESFLQLVQDMDSPHGEEQDRKRMYRKLRETAKQAQLGLA